MGSGVVERHLEMAQPTKKSAAYVGFNCSCLSSFFMCVPSLENFEGGDAEDSLSNYFHFANGNFSICWKENIFTKSNFVVWKALAIDIRHPNKVSHFPRIRNVGETRKELKRKISFLKKLKLLSTTNYCFLHQDSRSTSSNPGFFTSTFSTMTGSPGMTPLAKSISRCAR